MTHPLDPLSADEIRQAAAILRRDHGVDRPLAVRLDRAARAVEAAVRDRPRTGARAVVICWNRDDGAVYKARVSLTGDAVERWDEVPTASRT